MARPRNHIPSVPCLQRDRSKSFAYANVNGGREICGLLNSAEATVRYAAFIRQFQATGGRIDVNVRDATVCDVVVAAMERAKLEYRRPDGRPAATLDNVRQSAPTSADLVRPQPGPSSTSSTVSGIAKVSSARR